MLEGGPGVGKTRLAMEMAEYASRVGFKCVVGHCYERDEPFPYLPFSEIIESVWHRRQAWMIFVGGWGTTRPNWPSSHQAFDEFFRIFRNLWNCRRRRSGGIFSRAFLRRWPERLEHVRTCIILEDLHWADESTLALLVHLANRVAQLPVVIIGTYRDEYSDNNPAMIRTLEELIRMGIRPLKLGGLSKDAVAQMLHGLSKRQAPEILVSLIFDESQGNPFFVEELYRHLLEEGESSMRPANSAPTLRSTRSTFQKTCG